MSDSDQLDHTPATQLMGGAAGAAIVLTPEKDTRRVNLVVPPSRAIPVVFLPGIMGTHLRMTKARQEKLDRSDNRAWRPDDAWDTLTKFNDDPDERQLSFDPDETEVEVYEWSSDAPGTPESKKRFDASQANDKRHDNVPDNLADIPPLLVTDPVPTGPMAKPTSDTATAAQKARWRGWSEVLMGSYAPMLKELETRLNNAAKQGQLDNEWAFNYAEKPPSTWASSNTNAPTEKLSKEDIQKLEGAWFPVHAMGYNWLKSNGESAKFVAQRIKALIQLYKDKGFECPGVLVVTHSMGGLVARGLMHPKYGGLTSNEVLGVVHGVMPTVGAAATYKRMRTGFEGGGITGWIEKKILGPTGAHTTPVLANAQGPLELLPTTLYGMGWLEVQDSDGKKLGSWPQEPDAAEMGRWQAEAALCRAGLTQTVNAPQTLGTPEQDIYTQPNEAWWRLVNPEWVDPANKHLGKPGQAMDSVNECIGNALKFHKTIATTFHANTYATYGDDRSHLTYGRVVWRVTSGSTASAGSPQQWQLVSEDGEGELTLRGVNGTTLTLALQAPAEAGDGTVPAADSASKVATCNAAGKTFVQSGYDHQDSYKNHSVQSATLYSLVKLATQVLPTPAHA